MAFAAGGRNSFWLPADLVSLLGRTDLDDIRLADIRLPFRCFYFGFAGGLDVGLSGEPNVIDGAYVESFARGYDVSTATSLSFYTTYRAHGYLAMSRISLHVDDICSGRHPAKCS